MTAIAIAAGRIAIGAAAFAAPRAALRGWLGDDVDGRGTQMAIRAFAARDIALGLGTLAALDEPSRAKNWVEAGIIADAGDFTATLLGKGHGGALGTLGVLAVAGGATATGLWLRDQYDQSPDAVG